MALPLTHEGTPLGSSVPLPLCMENASLNIFSGEVRLPPEVAKSMKTVRRRLADMQGVLYEPDFLKEGNNAERVVHQIYRFIGDTETMIQAGLKYDITVILPGDWGIQLPTTTGHYHLPLEAEKSASPDFYQLIYGEALAILQRDIGGETEVTLLRPQLGEWVLFPPSYAHSVVSTGKDPAVFANICVRQPHLNYEPILARRGMAYYIVRDGGDYQLVQNSNYKKVREPIESRSVVRVPALNDLPKNTSFYWLVTHEPEALRFLAEPDRFPEVFEPDPIEPISESKVYPAK